MARKLFVGFLEVMLIFTVVAYGGSASAQYRPGQFPIRIGMTVVGNHPTIHMAEFMKERLEAESNGAISVSLFPGGQLGGDEAMIDDVRLGTLDMVIGGTQNAAPFVPSLQVLTLFYLFEDSDQLESVLTRGGPIFNYIQRKYEEYRLGLRLLSLSNGGRRNLYGRVPVHSLSDLAGVRMRVTASATENMVWSALGTLPIHLPFNEIYTGMQTGTIDFFDVTAASYLGNALYEVAPYITLTTHQFTITNVIFSEISFNRLPEEFQRLLESVAAEAGILGSRITNEQDADVIDLLIREHGVTVFDEIDVSEFRVVVEPLWDDIIAASGGEELFEIIMDQIN